MNSIGDERLGMRDREKGSVADWLLEQKSQQVLSGRTVAIDRLDG